MLDLAGLRFMDASGLAVISHGADRLEAAGGSLQIRTPRALIRKMLELTGFARLVEMERGESDYERRGPEQGDVGGRSRSAGPSHSTA